MILSYVGEEFISKTWHILLILSGELCRFKYSKVNKGSTINFHFAFNDTSCIRMSTRTRPKHERSMSLTCNAFFSHHLEGRKSMSHNVTDKWYSLSRYILAVDILFLQRLMLLHAKYLISNIVLHKKESFNYFPQACRAWPIMTSTLLVYESCSRPIIKSLNCAFFWLP